MHLHIWGGPEYSEVVEKFTAMVNAARLLFTIFPAVTAASGVTARADALPDADALRWLTDALDFSWTANLAADPEAPAHAPNRSPRSVRSGHYVLVEPTSLPEPYLVALSADMAQRL